MPTRNSPALGRRELAETAKNPTGDPLYSGGEMRMTKSISIPQAEGVPAPAIMQQEVASSGIFTRRPFSRMRRSFAPERHCGARFIASPPSPRSASPRPCAPANPPTRCATSSAGAGRFPPAIFRTASSALWKRPGRFIGVTSYALMLVSQHKEASCSSTWCFHPRGPTQYSSDLTPMFARAIWQEVPTSPPDPGCGCSPWCRQRSGRAWCPASLLRGTKPHLTLTDINVATALQPYQRGAQWCAGGANRR